MVSPKSVPPMIATARQLTAMAHALEQEAARRYRELAARMNLRHEPQLAELFLFLASVEDKHALQILAVAAEATTPAANLAQITWDLPENFDEEEGSSRRLTPYRALAVAVRNEDRAFAFYTYVAASAPDQATRRMAEELARDELDHAFLLRRERRKAFHRQSADQRMPGLQLPTSLAEFWQLRFESEWRIAQYHRLLAKMLINNGQDGAVFAAVAQEEENDARQAAARLGLPLVEVKMTDTPSVEDGLRLLEEVFDRYMDIADRAKDEAIVQEAQNCAAAAVRRLSLVNGFLKNALLPASA